MEDLTTFNIILIFAAGFFGSFLNILSGGGSVITIGILIWLGMDGVVANGTIRIAVLTGTLSAACKIKKENIIQIKEGLKYGLFTIPGALTGALLAVKVNNEVFSKFLSVVLIFILATLFLPKVKTSQSLSKKKEKWIYFALFIAGFYGGFIQIGIGFILIAIFRYLLDEDLLKVTGHKVFVVLTYTFPVVLLFAINNKIDWQAALYLSLGKVAGGWLSIKLAITSGEKIIKFFLAVSTIMMLVQLLV